MQVEEGWWEGILNGKTGMFPSNFIKELSDSDDAGIAQEEQVKPSKKKNNYSCSVCTSMCFPIILRG